MAAPLLVSRPFFVRTLNVPPFGVEYRSQGLTQQRRPQQHLPRYRSRLDGEVLERQGATKGSGGKPRRKRRLGGEC